MPRLLIVGASILGILLVIMFTDAGRTTAVHRATPTPTPTVAPTPTPTPIVGFQQYVDPTEGFSIEYPGTWVYIPDTPGIQFDDDISNPTYEVQVIVPSETTYAGLSGDPSDPSAWVDYTLSALARKFQNNFQQVPGPAPAITIGDTTWQSGTGLLNGDPSQGSFRVQVYATVYHGKPYIINLLAPDDKFSIAEKYFFTPMLQTFEFLPAKS